MAILKDSMNKGGDLPTPNPEITCPVVKAHLDELQKMEAAIPPEAKGAYDQVLLAGKKMMYSKDTREAITNIVSDENIPVPNKLGEGVANLVVMMDNQGNNTIPKEVIVPVAVSLMMEAADYLFECGIDVTEKDLSEGLKIMIYSIFNSYGVPPEQLDQMVSQTTQQMDMGGGAGEEPGETTEEPEPSEEDAFEQGFNNQARG